MSDSATHSQIDPLHVGSFGEFAALGHLVACQCQVTPRHVAFFKRRFATPVPGELALCEQLAQQILRLAGTELDDFAKGYDFICAIQKREEIYFRRHGAYRLKTVQQAVAEVYGNPEYMRSYMRGLLMTQVFWSNHTASMRFYVDDFLARNADGYDLLEIGPGHGLLLGRAASDPRARTVTGWDLSLASVQETHQALAQLGVERPFRLEVRDLFAHASGAAFDAVVFSEVLEHLEEPVRALQAIRAVMRPSARLYLNVPINSPAPDHLFLLRSPEEVVALVKDQGFSIERCGYFPATNYTIEAARKHQLTISVCVVAVKAGG
jgi:2-polyprenyl-3-methyl-5-hydroxy-6-metoxy-1,4-benzoquinol methylase